MVYINSDGTIGGRPWYKQISLFFTGFLNVVVAFFRTLFNPALNGKGVQYERNYQGPGGGPPRPPNRRIGRFATIDSCRAPLPGGG
ncbi:hypothetical protein RUM43_002489 [Polyplax serrata]|uniref:Selenoprotein K n=1 Tax=Polyplax serrata TaxID=468196 RepID=A0AAN8S612_POLSC